MPKLKLSEKELADIKASLAQLEVANEAGLELLAKDFKIPMNKSNKENGKAPCSLRILMTLEVTVLDLHLS